MPSDKVENALYDIRDNIVLAFQFLDGLSRETIADDIKSFYAVTRCLEIISEASRRLPPELKARHVHIDWVVIAAAGNFYRHQYEDVMAKRIWTTVSDSLPPLRKTIEIELRRLDMK